MKATRQRIELGKKEFKHYFNIKGKKMSEQPTCLTCKEYDFECKCLPEDKKILKDVSCNKEKK